MRRPGVWFLFASLALSAFGCSKGHDGSLLPPPVPPVLSQPVPGLETGSDFIALHWTGSADPNFNSYEVHLLPDSTTPVSSATLRAVLTDRSQTSYSVGGLQNQTYYIFAVRTVLKSGLASASHFVRAQTVPSETPAPECVTIRNPTGVTRKEMTFSWTTNREKNFLTYKLYFGPSPGFDPLTSGSLVGQTFRFKDTSVVVQNLAPLTVYYAKVMVYNFANKYCISNEVFDTTSDASDTIPPDPVSFYPITKKDVTGTSIHLRWQPSKASDFDHYDIHMGFSDGFVDSVSNLKGNISERLDTNLVIGGLKPANKYYFKIFATDHSGLRSKPLVNIGGTTQPPVDPTFIFGSFGVGLGRMNLPTGVAVDSRGRTYVSSPTNHRVDLFANPVASAPDTTVVRSYGGAADTLGLVSPGALALDDKDNLFVGDVVHVVKLSPDGVLLLRFGQLGADTAQFTSVSAIAVDGDENIWVADASNNTVQKLDANGHFLLKLTRAELGALISPSGLVYDPVRRLMFVLDSGNGRVVGFTTLGVPVPGQIGQGVGEPPGFMSAPTSIATDGAGHLLVGDTGNNRVQVFADTTSDLPTFVLKSTVGTGEPEDLETVKFSILRPRGVAVFGSKAVVVDSGHHRALVCDLTLNAPVLSRGRRLSRLVSAPAATHGKFARSH